MAKRQQDTPKAKRQAVSLRFHAGLRDQVAGIADRENYTLNEAINVLVKRGIEAERWATLAFGSQPGLALGRSIIAAAETATVRHDGHGGKWFYLPDIYEIAAAAMKHTIDMWHPDVREHQEHLAILASGKRSA
jgi:hypothetical protein